MMLFSIFQPASAGLREGAPRAGTVQPVKSLPLKSSFHGSADCSDAGSTKQSSVTMPTEMPLIGILLPWLIWRADIRNTAQNSREWRAGSVLAYELTATDVSSTHKVLRAIFPRDIRGLVRLFK